MRASESANNGGQLPGVTIVTPAYNQADYLAETIESVLAQNYPNIEYIVIDDGSTDHTQDVLRRYNGRIRWESQENQGQAATLNRGWSMAGGEIIGYLSSDDLLMPDAVGTCVGYMLDNPEAVLVYPDFELIDAEGRFVRKFEAPEYSYRDLVVNLVCHPGPGAFFWKAYFDAAGGWNTDLKQIPDLEYWLRLSQLGQFKRVPKVLASSRLHEESQSFRRISDERAMEPVNSLATLIRKGVIRFPSRRIVNWSMASAYLLSFRMLVRSGCFGAGMKSLTKAVLLRPGLLASHSAWRVIGSSFFGKTVYRWLFKTR